MDGIEDWLVKFERIKWIKKENKHYKARTGVAMTSNKRINSLDQFKSYSLRTWGMIVKKRATAYYQGIK